MRVIDACGSNFDWRVPSVKYRDNGRTFVESAANEDSI